MRACAAGRVKQCRVGIMYNNYVGMHVIETSSSAVSTGRVGQVYVYVGMHVIKTTSSAVSLYYDLHAGKLPCFSC